MVFKYGRELNTVTLSIWNLIDHINRFRSLSHCAKSRFNGLWAGFRFQYEWNATNGIKYLKNPCVRIAWQETNWTIHRQKENKNHVMRSRFHRMTFSVCDSHWNFQLSVSVWIGFGEKEKKNKKNTETPADRWNESDFCWFSLVERLEASQLKTEPNKILQIIHSIHWKMSALSCFHVIFSFAAVMTWKTKSMEIHVNRIVQRAQKHSIKIFSPVVLFFMWFYVNLNEMRC